MTDRSVVVVLVALLVGALTYGGLVGIQAVLEGEDPTVPGTGDVEVQGTTYHLDRAGRPTVVGEVANDRASAITDVTVTVTFLRDGEVVREVSGSTLLETVPAGETAPFDIHMPTAASVDDYRVSVEYERGDPPVTGLSVAEARISYRSQDQITVTGSVRNTADRPLVFTRLVASFYDGNGSVIGARTVHSNQRLAPGESVEFRVTFRTLGDVPSLARDFARYELDPVAREPDDD